MSDEAIIGTTMCPACQVPITVRHKHTHFEGREIRCSSCQQEGV